MLWQRLLQRSHAGSASRCVAVPMIDVAYKRKTQTSPPPHTPTTNTHCSRRAHIIDHLTFPDCVLVLSFNTLGRRCLNGRFMHPIFRSRVLPRPCQREATADCAFLSLSRPPLEQPA